MKKQIYSVYDKVAEMFSNLHVEINEASAIRAFQESFKDNPNKNDYEIYFLGEYTDHNGTIEGVAPRKIYSGLDINVNNVFDMPTNLNELAE
jgi:hypothetical protein